jgi:MarR family transcriptional regulator for hemolysin
LSSNWSSSVVALLDQLEDKGLVRRVLDPSDRRVRLVELTDAGRVTLARAIEIAMGVEATVCAGFSPVEREALMATLRRVGANMDLVAGVHPASIDQ